MENVKLCNDCKYHATKEIPKSAPVDKDGLMFAVMLTDIVHICTKGAGEEYHYSEFDYVFGREKGVYVTTEPQLCSFMRKEPGGGCGHQANYFEPV